MSACKKKRFSNQCCGYCMWKVTLLKIMQVNYTIAYFMKFVMNSSSLLEMCDSVEFGKRNTNFHGKEGCSIKGQKNQVSNPPPERLFVYKPHYQMQVILNHKWKSFVQAKSYLATLKGPLKYTNTVTLLVIEYLWIFSIKLTY